MSLLVVIPTYEHLEYAKSACETLLETTPGAVPLVVDDASSEWVGFDHSTWPSGTQSYRFIKNGGLTRSWNYGLRYAQEHKFEYVCCTNSDVLFTPFWFEGIRWALDNGVDLAGPLTNAPGHQPKQQVKLYLPDYKVTDDPDYLASTALALRKKNPKVFTRMKINGFCMVAKTATWWQGAFSETDVFNPKFKLTKNEDELQGRWQKMEKVTAVVPSSFVFHYRGVSRKGATCGREGQGWFRKRKA